PVERKRLARPLAGGRRSVRADLRKPRGVEEAQARVGRRDEEAILEPHADVAGGGVDVPACEEALADAADLLARAAFVIVAHRDSWKAFVKKSSPPKFPDLSARCSTPEATGECAAHHGTPGSICGPMRIMVTPSARA